TAAPPRLRDGAPLGTGSAGDTIDLQVSRAAVHHGSVNLRGDYIKSSKTSNTDATMVETTVTVNGAAVTVVTITVGSPTNPSALRTATAPGAMVWSPSGSATDLSGAPCST